MKKEIEEQLHEQSIILEPQACFNDAILRVENHRIVYSYNLIVMSLMKFYTLSYMDALEWIEYNTIQSLVCMGEYAPIVEEE